MPPACMYLHLVFTDVGPRPTIESTLVEAWLGTGSDTDATSTSRHFYLEPQSVLPDFLAYTRQ
jgi:hypothetical protein